MRKETEKMKEAEAKFHLYLPKDEYSIIRVDGRAFHTWTKGLESPFSERFVEAMNATAVALAKEVSGTKLVYVQSDEISLVVSAFGDSQQYFGGRVDKTVSITASLASVTLSRAFPEKQPALFDSRVLSLVSAGDVADYLIDRQVDAVRNSIQSVGQSEFSHKQMLGLKTKQVREKLISEGRKAWEDYKPDYRFGRLFVLNRGIVKPTVWVDRNGDSHSVDAVRSGWQQEVADRFTEEYLVSLLNR
jgi:tRNA(His) guanylyltransferase